MESMYIFNPNRAGLFWLIQARGGGGGGGFRRPPSDLGCQSARKITKFGTYVELVHTNMLTKFQYLKSKRFLIMQIYVNYMYVFLFFIITDKIRFFEDSKLS